MMVDTSVDDKKKNQKHVNICLSDIQTCYF